MSYFRSTYIFLMGFLLGSVVMSAGSRGYPTTLEVIGFVLYPLCFLVFAVLQKRFGDA